MPTQNAFTIVIPTRDDPAICRKAMDSLLLQPMPGELNIRVVFLVNDTRSDAFALLQDAAQEERFRPLKPLLLQARQDWPTVEENIRHTLGERLDTVDERFLIVGNSDIVDLDALAKALRYLLEHELELLLIGVLNREVYQGKPVRQIYTTPRHLNPKNRLPATACHGKTIFADTVNDYGAVDYLAFIGCQIYTKAFFQRMSSVQVELVEPLYSIPMATLEATTRQECRVGFWPEIVVARIDHLQAGPNSGEQPVNWWIVKQRTDRGLSNHLMFSVLSSSLRLSKSAFEVFINSQSVSTPRARSQYVFSNVLFSLVQQICVYIRLGLENPSMRYSPVELQEIASFGERLHNSVRGLHAEHAEIIGRWLMSFASIRDYADQKAIAKLLAPSEAVLKLLDMRQGMERWIAQLS